MASYFVACHALPDGAHAVHDRSRCPPACFPLAQAHEYLGEFSEAAQALAVARLRFAHARGCACCEAGAAASPRTAQRKTGTLSALRS